VANVRSFTVLREETAGGVFFSGGRRGQKRYGGHAFGALSQAFAIEPPFCLSDLPG
jgi:hypothetical protein